jgi:hypothetical protein
LQMVVSRMMIYHRRELRIISCELRRAFRV